MELPKRCQQWVKIWVKIALNKIVIASNLLKK